MDTAKEEKLVRVNLKLDPALHKALKVWCVKRSLSIQVGLRKIVEAVVEKETA